MMKPHWIPITLCLTACDPTPPPDPEIGPATAPAFETQIQAIEKARTAEDQLRDAAEVQREQLDAAGR